MKKWLALVIVATGVHMFVAWSEAVAYAQDEPVTTACSVSQDCGWFNGSVSCSCSGSYCDCGAWGGSNPGVSCWCASGCANGSDCNARYADGCGQWGELCG
jgi:hypothetical protein